MRADILAKAKAWQRDRAPLAAAPAAPREPWVRREVIGRCTLYLADCLDVLPVLGCFDALVTDPPYGINADVAAAKNNGKWGWKFYGDTAWDAERPSKSCFRLMMSRSRQQIIWGGNYFADMLPPTMCWLVWDKGQREFSLADCELAWTSRQNAARVITLTRGKALLDGKTHPTQKPVEVMKWCISHLPTPNRTILDPFMGSGTTGVAAVHMGRAFVGIERDPEYFATACRRIAAAYAQPDLLIEAAPAPPSAEQLGLL